MRARRRWRKLVHEDRGQVLILMVVAMVVVLGFTALVIDLGRVTVEKQRLQNAADAAALAGVQHLPDSASDAITTANSYSSLNGVSPSEVVSVATGSDQITVTHSRTVGLTFGQLLGIESHTVEASATARIEVATGFAIDEGGVFPYAVWGGNPGDTVLPGETVTFFSNQYEKANGIDDDNPNWAVPGDNNSFAGYFKHGGEIIYVDDQEQTFSSGGSACGHQSELIAVLNEKRSSGEPVVLPVITRASGEGDDVNFIIAAWVAVRVTEVSCPQAYRGVVQSNVQSPLGYSEGTPQSPSFAPWVYTASLVD